MLPNLEFAKCIRDMYYPDLANLPGSSHNIHKMLGAINKHLINNGIDTKNISVICRRYIWQDNTIAWTFKLCPTPPSFVIQEISFQRCIRPSGYSPEVLFPATENDFQWYQLGTYTGRDQK